MYKIKEIKCQDLCNQVFTFTFVVCLPECFIWYLSLRSPSGDIGFKMIMCGHEIKSLSVDTHR